MIGWKREWWMVMVVLGLAVMPGWCSAQGTDVEKAQREAQQAAEKAQREAEKALQNARTQLLYQLSIQGANRLGASLESPSAAVAAQLDLPRGQGQVVKSVQPNSAAAKAGILANDILLELDGKPVSSNMGDFEKAINALKPDTGVEAVVLRKGQKTTIKGLMLAKADQPAQFNAFGQLQPAPGTFFQTTRAMTIPPVPGQIVPPEVQGQLKLTAEQKEKLAKLQKDTEAKLMELLTDEQKKQLEDLKKTQLRRQEPQLQPGQPVPPKPEDIRKRQEELKKQLEKQLENNPRGQNPKAPPNQAAVAQDVQDVVIQFRTGRGAGANRLGATLETPSDTVVNQLNLPQGQGVVVKNIPPNSAAAKAGLQPNDILLEVGGKTISRNPAEFDKTVEQIKPDTAVDAVVLRKGEKTTVKGVSLAAAPPAQQGIGVRSMPAFPKVPGDILPSELQGQLKLTAEQKEKLAKLQKDTEAKLMELLTDDQKKQLEELKKNKLTLQLKLLIDNIFEEEIELIPLDKK